MFGFFKKKPPFEPPSQRQLNYAKKLGITVSSTMSRKDISDAIAKAEAKNPKIARQREHINRSQQEKAEAEWAAACGPELLDAERRWQEFSAGSGYMIAIYNKGDDAIVDVLRVDDATIEGQKKTLKLHVAAPKLKKDKDIGGYLEWDKEFQLAIDKLLYYEPLPPGFDDFDLSAYETAVKKGLKTAATLKAK